MAIRLRVGLTWETVVAPQVYRSGVWRSVASRKVYRSGTWVAF